MFFYATTLLKLVSGNLTYLLLIQVTILLLCYYTINTTDSTNTTLIHKYYFITHTTNLLDELLFSLTFLLVLPFLKLVSIVSLNYTTFLSHLVSNYKITTLFNY